MNVNILLWNVVIPTSYDELGKRCKTRLTSMFNLSDHRVCNLINGIFLFSYKKAILCWYIVARHPSRQCQRQWHFNQNKKLFRNNYISKFILHWCANSQFSVPINWFIRIRANPNGNNQPTVCTPECIFWIMVTKGNNDSFRTASNVIYQLPQTWALWNRYKLWYSNAVVSMVIVNRFRADEGQMKSKYRQNAVVSSIIMLSHERHDVSNNFTVCSTACSG